MLPHHELRDQELARQFLLQGLWLQRAVHPRASGIRPALEWTLEIADAGHPLPPIGIVADLANIMLPVEREIYSYREFTSLPGLPSGLARTYEDIVLGKAMADASVSRAADVVRRLQARDRARGVAYVINQCTERIGLTGVMLSPAVIKSLIDAPVDEVLSRGWDSLNRGILPLLVKLYEECIGQFRQAADLLAPEDIFELEHGTALAELGQRVALRQILHLSDKLEAALPSHKPRPVVQRREVATRLVDEDNYPVGGFASISNRGSVESLLYSQLAFMEPDAKDRPDLFDMRFLRDELLYYSRDENQFFRRRRSFVFVLMPELTHARFKDADLPTQRIVVMLALLVVAIRKLTSWLSDEALLFDFVFVADGEIRPLALEETLLAMVLREPIANGTARLLRATDLRAAQDLIAEQSRRSMCHVLTLSVNGAAVHAEFAAVHQLIIENARPRWIDNEGVETAFNIDVWESWQEALVRLLESWI